MNDFPLLLSARHLTPLEVYEGDRTCQVMYHHGCLYKLVCTFHKSKRREMLEKYCTLNQRRVVVSADLNHYSVWEELRGKRLYLESDAPNHLG